MDRDIPSVLTTLAGVASLTDLLAEMPLPTPLPQVLSNKSLLFHPRVAEEALKLLGVRDDKLVPQLVHSLVQTSADHIELKDHYTTTDNNIELQETIPELLRAILEKNPNVFSGPEVNSPRPLHWNHTGHGGVYSSGHVSPTGTRYTPQGSPAPPASARFPPHAPMLNMSTRPSVITEQHKTMTTIHQQQQQSQQQHMQPTHHRIQHHQPQLPLQHPLPPAMQHQSLHTPHHQQQLQQQQPPPSQQQQPTQPHHQLQPHHQQLQHHHHHHHLQQEQPQHHHQQHHPQHQPQPHQPQPHQPQPHQPQPHQPQPHQPQPHQPQPHQPQPHQPQPHQPQPHQPQPHQPQPHQPQPHQPQPHQPPQHTQQQHPQQPQQQHIAQQQQPQQHQQPHHPQPQQHHPQQLQQQSTVINNCSDVNLYFTYCNATDNLANDLSFSLTYSTNSSTDSGVDVCYSNSSNTLSMDVDHSVDRELQDQVVTSTNIRGPSPAQASDAPAPVPAPYITETPVIQPQLVSTGPSKINNQPVVRLDRLSVEDQVLMQKSLSKFAENRPQLASQLGITSSIQNNRLAENSSGSDTDEKSGSKTHLRKNHDNKKSYAEQDEDYVPDTFTALAGSRKRKTNNAKEEKSTEVIPIAKPKLRRVERKFVPVLEKLSVEELMETNTYHRFNRSIETVLENVNENLIAGLGKNNGTDEENVVQPDLLLNRCQLQDLCTEAAKLKVLGAMEMIPIDRLVRLLNMLEINVRSADRVSLIADPEENENIRQMWMETAVDRVMGAVDASLTCLYIMTSPNMPKRVYLEDVIDRVILFIMFQLHNTIFPSYDSVYRIDPKKKDTRKKKSNSQASEKSIQILYNKVHELVSLVSELLNIQVMTDTTVLHASSMGVPPFFAENVSELQLSCLKLVTTIFTRYEKHRRLLLDDILASIARLPSSKRSLRTYRLNSEEHIQMLTALVLQLIQCVVALPENLANEVKDSAQNENTPKQMDKDIFICNKYEIATKIAGTFLTVFLNKCGSKTEEIDYRPLFENFVQDLLTTVNKPEWPATELLLSLLGTMLVKNFSNKSTDMSLRVASLDYLGVVAARLRRDTVLSRCKVNTIDQMIKDIKSEEMKDGDIDFSKHNNIEEDNEEERTKFLQRVLLDYLAVNSHKDEAHRYARHFYIAQWYKDATIEKTRLAAGEKNNKKQTAKENHRNRKSNNKRGESDEDVEELSDVEETLTRIRGSNNDQNNSEIFRIIDARKKFYISKIRPFQETISSGNRIQVLQTYIDYSSAELISQYLASKRSFSQSFDKYLKTILLVLRENSIAIRTKAMKCLTMIVEADPSVLGKGDMQIGVNHSFLDHSTSVREAAVDLVGKFVLSRPELIDKYYDMLSTRILDTGVSVRKRVIKILKDICIECPEFPKIPEICVKMIRRVNDEEGIRKLVMEVFQNMWFTPTPERPSLDKAALLRKVMNITDVVASSRDIGLEWFEQLLLSLFKPKEDKDDSTKIQVEPPRALLLACRQIVDCLIENVLRLEESGMGVGEQGGCSQRLVACLTTLNLFAKIRPQLLVKHASTLQPYLSLKCQTKGDITIISSVARTLELVVPLMEHPSETFLAQLEEDSIKLIIQHDRSVISSCLSCLGSIVNNVTRNFKLIRDCFNKYFGNLMKFKDILENEPLNPLLIRYRPLFRRALFIVGLLLRHFDFTDKEVIGDLPSDIKDQVFHALLYFLRQEDEDIQNNTLKAIGFICIRHYEFMLDNELKKFYHKMLIHEDAPLKMKSEVLINIEMYLMEEDNRMIKLDQEWSKRSKEENLKEMGDISSGMASTIIQLYLKEILTSFLHPNILVRHASLKVIHLILQQGLVHPVQIVPYLICMSTDSEKVVSHSADKQLLEIEKKYPGFIHTKSQLGVRLSYQLQTILQACDIVRGSRIREQGEYPTALNGYLYSLLRGSRQQRRALALNMLKQFDEQVRTSLSYMLYLADNLAYFPYIVQDEPLFIVHHIDIMISVSGTNLLQSFREGLLVNESEQLGNSYDGNQQPQTVPVSALDEDDEDEDVLVARLPKNTTELQSCITAAQGCLLLLVLKQHLKDIYGLSDGKISQYSPSEVAKVYEKTASRRSNVHFNPKATLNRLKQGAPPDILDMEGRKDLIAQYLDFKQLMLKLDPDDPEDEENTTLIKTGGMNATGSNIASGPPPSVPAVLTNPTATCSVLNEADQIMLTNYKEPSQKVPKLVISNRRTESSENRRSAGRSQKTPDKSKKHRHKKKRKKFVSSSGDDSGNDYSDPDYMA